MIDLEGQGLIEKFKKLSVNWLSLFFDQFVMVIFIFRVKTGIFFIKASEFSQKCPVCEGLFCSLGIF